MTKAVRLIGYWDGPEAVDGWPDVCAFVTAVDADLQAGDGWLTWLGATPEAGSGHEFDEERDDGNPQTHR